MRPGADDRDIGRQLSRVGADCGQPTAVEPKARGGRPDDFAAVAPELRDELQQRKPFGSLYQEAQLNLGRTQAVLQDAFERMLKPFEISGTRRRSSTRNSGAPCARMRRATGAARSAPAWASITCCAGAGR